MSQPTPTAPTPTAPTPTAPTAGPVRLGVLGCASIAARKTLPALAGRTDLRLAAVASRDAAKARRFGETFGGEPVCGYEALLARTDVDAVYVPLPAALHAEWIERALRAGKHVLAEKPLATRCEDAHRLVALARERGLVLAENFMFLLHPVHREVARLVSDGLIGQPRVFTAEFAIPALPDDDIRYAADVGGGALADVGGYPLRAATLLLGDDVEVCGAVLHHSTRRGVDVGGSVLLSTPAGVSAHLTFGMEHDYRCRYEIWGSAGRIGLDRAFTPPADHRPVLRIERAGTVTERAVPAYDQFAGVLESFAASVRTGGTSVLTGASILRQADLVAAVRSAARSVPVTGR